mmetsp:Transcript_3821/g.8045  ORF Transcript_3821/g.8045 Transcript_3821/m.8045 type:complete len:93 (+) Transcript_3821:196-474(+)
MTATTFRSLLQQSHVRRVVGSRPPHAALHYANPGAAERPVSGGGHGQKPAAARTLATRTSAALLDPRVGGAVDALTTVKVEGNDSLDNTAEL